MTSSILSRHLNSDANLQPWTYRRYLSSLALLYMLSPCPSLLSLCPYSSDLSFHLPSHPTSLTSVLPLLPNFLISSPPPPPYHASVLHLCPASLSLFPLSVSSILLVRRSSMSHFCLRRTDVWPLTLRIRERNPSAHKLNLQ